MRVLPLVACVVFFAAATVNAQTTDTISSAREELVYKRMLKKNSKNATPNVGLAKIYFERNDYVEASKYASAALNAGTDTIPAMWLLYCKALDGAGRSENALKYCQKAVAQFPNHALLWAELAFLQFKYREYEQAISASERSLKLQPLNPDACLVYALSMYERSNNPQAALPILYALILDNRKAVMPRDCWLFLQLAKQKHANIPIPLYDKRLAIIDPIQITTFMYPEKSFAITLESFDEADFRVTADEYIQNLKGNTDNALLLSMVEFMNSLKNEKHQNTALFVAMRYTDNKVVTDWLKIHSEDIRQYASWLDKHLPQPTVAGK